MMKNKVILVTGAGRGIGQATAIKLAKLGAIIILHGRNESCLSNTIEILEEMKLKYDTVTYEISNEKAIKEAALNIKKKHGHLDGLVNNAGVMHEGLLGMLPTETIQNQFTTNVLGTMLQTQYATKLMKNSGSIVNLSSIIGIHGSEGSSAYAASKSAIIGLTKSMSKELSPKSIRVNAVAPGFIETDLTMHYGETKRNAVLQNIKMNRFGKPEDVANLIAFLLSDYSSYITGQIIGVDGGMVI